MTDEIHPPDEDILARARQWIFDRTVAVYVKKSDGNPVQWGSGVLSRVGGVALLLTASHVMEIVREGVEVLVGAMDSANGGLVPIGQQRVVRSEIEVLDIAHLRLPADAATALESGKRFVEFGEVEWSKLARQGRYFVAGYPIQITKTNHQAETIFVGPFTAATQLQSRANDQPDSTLVLAHDRNSPAIDREGDRVKVPELQGISGCGIWRIWAVDELNDLSNCNESWIRLAGIEHRATREAIIGTFARHALDMIIGTEPVEWEVSAAGARLTVR